MAGLQIKTTGIEDYLDESGQAFIKALVMGQASAGKTRSASFWPKQAYAPCASPIQMVFRVSPT